MNMNKGILTLGIILWGTVASFAVLVTPLFSQPVAAQAGSCNQRFLTMPVWYRGLGTTCGSADIDSVADNPELGGKLGTAIMIIGLNVVEILMHLAAYVASVFIIIGGFKYMLSAGSPDANAKGRKTIINAVVGLVISMVAITLVSYVVKTLAG